MMGRRYLLRPKDDYHTTLFKTYLRLFNSTTVRLSTRNPLPTFYPIVRGPKPHSSHPADPTVRTAKPHSSDTPAIRFLFFYLLYNNLIVKNKWFWRTPSYQIWNLLFIPMRIYKYAWIKNKLNMLAISRYK